MTRSGWRHALRATPPILDDALRRIRGATPRYIPIVGEPGSLAAVTTPGALDGWYSTVPAGAVFDNRMAAADVVGIAMTSAKHGAGKIAAPLLVCVSKRETLANPCHAEDVGRRAVHGTVRHYDGDHFQIYHPPLVARLLADQIRFLQEHLHVINR